MKAIFIRVFLYLNIYHYNCNMNPRKYLLFVCIISVNFIFSQDMKYIDSLQKAFDAATVDTIKIDILSDISDAWYVSNPEKALEANTKMLAMTETAIPRYKGIPQKNLYLMKAAAYNNLGMLSMDKGDVMECLEYYNKSVPMFEASGNKEYLATAYNNIGFVYENQGDVERGMEFYFKSLKLREEMSDNRGIGESYNNIAYMYNVQGEVDKALETFQIALKYFEKANNNQGIGLIYNNLGDLYKQKGKYDEAISVLQKSSVIKAGLSDHKGLSSVYVNIGDVYERQKSYDSAKKYYDMALLEGQLAENKSRITGAFQNLASLALVTKDVTKAFEYAHKALSLSFEVGFPEKIRDSYSILSKIYVAKNDYKNAYESFKSYKEMSDSILSDATKQDAIKQQMKYSFDKREIEVKKEKEKSDFEHQSEVKRQNFVIYISVAVLLIVLVFSVFLYNRFRVTKKQKTIIEAQKHLVEEQKEIVDEKNKEITDSINYAKRIQQAILPPERIFQNTLTNSFVLFKPKDIVAGDFYWMEIVSDLIIFSAADCTGHGVPGAMVSVVCNNALNRSVREFGLTDPGKILDKTRELVIETFEKSDHEVRDGMDISLCAYHKKTKMMHWAGANNPLWVARKKEWMEMKPDKQPIGKYETLKPFTTNKIQLEEGDVFYIFTDGYADQFGGPKGKKFKYKPFQELLIENVSLSMPEQKQKLDKAFEDWKGNLEQVDDVCVIGVGV